MIEAAVSLSWLWCAARAGAWQLSLPGFTGPYFHLSSGRGRGSGGGGEKGIRNRVDVERSTDRLTVTPAYPVDHHSTASPAGGKR